LLSGARTFVMTASEALASGAKNPAPTGIRAGGNFYQATAVTIPGGSPTAIQGLAPVGVAQPGPDAFVYAPPPATFGTPDGRQVPNGEYPVTVL
jgi:hypothetical protein